MPIQITFRHCHKTDPKSITTNIYEPVISLDIFVEMLIRSSYIRSVPIDICHSPDSSRYFIECENTLDSKFTYIHNISTLEQICNELFTGTLFST